MKVVYVTAYLPSYRDAFWRKMTMELAVRGIEFEILSGKQLLKKEVTESQISDCPIKCFQTMESHFMGIRYVRMPWMYKYLEQNMPDAIVLFYMPANITMWKIVQLCIKRNIPFGIWRCGYIRNDYGNMALGLRNYVIDYVTKRAQVNITYGSYYKSILIKRGIPEDNIIVAQNTIDVEAILQRTKCMEKKFSNKQTKVLFVGALTRAKLLFSSIKAIEKLTKDGYDVEFTIVGGGDVYDDIYRYIHQNNLSGIIKLVGKKINNEVIPFFLNADVFLLAGIGGLAINEAMAYGLPIISTNADWTVCDLIDGNGYFMDKYGDVDLQYDCLKKFISLTLEEKVVMSKKSLELISQKASLCNMVEKHINACEILLRANNVNK